MPAAISWSACLAWRRELLGERDDAMELRVVFLEARQIELREVGRSDLPALDEPRQVRQREKCELLVRAGHRHVDALSAERHSLAWKFLPWGNGIEDDCRLGAVAKARGSQPREARHVPPRPVELLEEPALFIGRERHSGDSLRRLEHVDRDRRGVLRDGRERTGHQRRSDAGRRTAFDESTPVDRALPFVHVVLPQVADVLVAVAVGRSGLCFYFFNPAVQFNTTVNGTDALGPTGVTPEPWIACTVHLAHTACAECGHDLVRPEANARLQRQWDGRRL